MTLREVLQNIKGVTCLGCSYGKENEKCCEEWSESNNPFCPSDVDTLESALKEWAGSGLLSDEELDSIDYATFSCSQNHKCRYEHTSCEDCLKIRVAEAQVLKIKLEYEGRIQELFTELDKMLFSDGDDQFRYFNVSDYVKLKEKYGGK
jgi:hypothetical protein